LSHFATMCWCYDPTMWWPYCHLRPVFCQYVQLSVGTAKLESCQFEPGLLLNVRNGVWRRHSISGQRSALSRCDLRAVVGGGGVYVPRVQ
jgi:hypothetical protein